MLFDLPKEQSSIIKVIGIGGGGCNAVNHMFRQGIKDVNFVICNTDSQALETSPVPNRIQLGPELTKGRGAGAHPEKGQAATLESVKEVKELLEKNTEMVFITAGMGGGTGTGGAPVVARIAREMGILTVAIVTLPFSFEGKKRIEQAHRGIAELKEHVDSIIVIVNDKIREVFGDLVFSEAFAMADDVLTTAARGIAEIITIPGYVNVDFEDVKTVLRDSGVAIMGTGRAAGENRAIDAVEAALSSPLLNDTNIQGARHVLLNITSGRKEVRMDEISEITEYVQEAAGQESEIIWGNCKDETLEDELSVTVIATGFDHRERATSREGKRETRTVLPLHDQPEQHAKEPAQQHEVSPSEPRLRTPGSPAGRTIVPFGGVKAPGSTPEPESEVLPFAYSLEDLAQTEPATARVAPGAFDTEVVGRKMEYTPVGQPNEAETPSDPAQIALAFEKEIRPVSLIPGGEDDDPEWSDEEDEEDGELDWDDLEDDDEEFKEEEDDIEDRKGSGNTLVWTFAQQGVPVELPTGEGIIHAENNILAGAVDPLKSGAPALSASTPTEPVAMATKPQEQNQPEPVQSEQDRYPKAKPGLRVRTVYPDGPLATPPMLPLEAAPPAQPPVQTPVPVAAQTNTGSTVPPSEPAVQASVPASEIRQVQPVDGNPATQNPDTISEADRQEFIRRHEERRRRLRSMSIRPNSSIEELEATPAYLRRNVHLNDVPHSSEETISRLHLGEGDEGVVSKPNSFLYNVVD